VAAYIVVDISAVHDPDRYAEYRAGVPPEIQAAGGEYLVRGGDVQVLEGGWKPGRLVIVRFKSVEDARRWWEAPEYASLKRLRQQSTDTNMVLVEGVAPAAGQP
jgi:uncharacterized protein (DUF1330 family)